MKIVILAGGSGTRLWPLSRKKFPKQAQLLFGHKTLLQITYSRIKRGFNAADIFISTRINFVKEVKRQLPKLKNSQLIIEPVGRETAAAIGLAAVTIGRKNFKEIIAIINSDHFIKNEKEFLRFIKLAGQSAQNNPDKIILLGINPTYPETGYGYIKLGQQVGLIAKEKIFQVDNFIEKPDLNTAKKYLRDWSYLWNPAYFVFRADNLMQLYKKYLPSQYKFLIKIKNNPGKLKTEFPKIKPISIDYGIMERTKKLLCMPTNFGWTDIGHWRTIQELLSKNKSDNVVKGRHIHLDSTGNLVYSYSNKLIATLGVKNFIIIETKDAILVCPKNRAQDVKKIVQQIEKQGLVNYL